MIPSVNTVFSGSMRPHSAWLQRALSSPGDDRFGAEQTGVQTAWGVSVDQALPSGEMLQIIEVPDLDDESKRDLADAISVPEAQYGHRQLRSVDI